MIIVFYLTHFGYKVPTPGGNTAAAGRSQALTAPAITPYQGLLQGNIISQGHPGIAHPVRNSQFHGKL